MPKIQPHSLFARTNRRIRLHADRLESIIFTQIFRSSFCSGSEIIFVQRRRGNDCSNEGHLEGCEVFISPRLLFFSPHLACWGNRSNQHEVFLSTAESRPRAYATYTHRFARGNEIRRSLLLPAADEHYRPSNGGRCL